MISLPKKTDDEGGTGKGISVCRKVGSTVHLYCLCTQHL